MKNAKTFSAAVLESLGQPLRIIDVEIPHLLKGQVLVKVLYAAVCHSQLMEVRGKRGEDNYLPHMLGHEGSGEVIKVGEGVSKVKLGDKVVLGWIKGDGLEAGGSVYQCDDKVINAGAVTTFSNYSVVSENRLVIIPDGIDDETAVLFGCALPTGAGLVLNQLKPTVGSTVLVFGLGGIGLCALLALRHFEPSQIIVFDIQNHKLELAKEFGATHCFLANEQGLAKFDKAFPDGVDYAIECAGQIETIQTAFSLIRRGGGKCIFTSHPSSGEMLNIDPFELICGKEIQGSWGGASKPDQDIPIIAKIIKKYALPIEKLLSKKYRLIDINQALDDLEAGKVFRPLIVMNHNTNKNE